MILKGELKNSKKEIRAQIVEFKNKIDYLENEISEKLTIKNAPQFAVDKVIDLATQVKQLTNENGYFTRKQGLTESIKTAADNLSTLKETILDGVCGQINIKMYELNKLIYTDDRHAPTLNIHGDKYTFNTYGDTGNGIAFANVITFDLVLLYLTCLPAIAYDLPLLKNIKNPALENIIELYSKSSKQIFIAIDKINSYKVDTAKAISDHKVLQLSKNKLLFIKNWKQEDNEEKRVKLNDSYYGNGSMLLINILSVNLA
jgi:hypothetical protein